MSPNMIMVIGAALIALVTLRPKLLHAPVWRATITPLASIIGSGFLVAGPILAHVAGDWAWVAMTALCALAYVFGAAIRHNITHVEPMLSGTPPRDVALLERASDYALAFSYFVSVSYYLNLFASFALRADAVIDPHAARWLATGVIAALGLLGTVRGLHALEHVEVAAVGIKLALIGGLLAALTWAGILAIGSGAFSLPSVHHQTGYHEICVLLGLVILVQGFETSRYLGEAYDGPLRIRTMRYAQLMSAAIYVVFILLATPYFTGRLPREGGETEIIEMLSPLGSAVAPLIIFAALASQLSAAVADMNGAGGLLAGASRNVIPVKLGYFATACCAIFITWAANIFEIIAYASKAFVVYYGLQSILAALVVARRDDPHRIAKVTLFLAAAVAALVVIALGLPADSG